MKFDNYAKVYERLTKSGESKLDRKTHKSIEEAISSGLSTACSFIHLPSSNNLKYRTKA